ncbi:MAG: hypothetical protein E7255_08765 [Lachnospiraceae bacterium]|jgi:hypothetical protein|nr:hypothetical protein [Lachnospiraceae bacterium]
MRRTIIALGDRSICGDYKSVKAAGDLNIADSVIRRLTCAGDLSIVKSKIGKTTCAGYICAEASEFHYLKAAGAIDFQGVCQGKIIIAKGHLSADYLECQILRNGFKMASVKIDSNNQSIWSGSYKAEILENTAPLHLDFDYEFKNIISLAPLISENEIVCENFYSFNRITAPEVNAENIFLLAHDGISINQLAGSNVTIKNKFKPDKLFRSIPKSQTYRKIKGERDMVSVKSIEADRIQIEYTKAELVSGQDVIIGELCIIERVEYRNSIRISEKSIVNEVVKV